MSLTGVLKLLVATVSNNPGTDFNVLTVPLERWACACDEYRQVIERYIKNSRDESTKTKVLEWLTQKYLQGDINEFKAMVASYKERYTCA